MKLIYTPLLLILLIGCTTEQSLTMTIQSPVCDIPVKIFLLPATNGETTIFKDTYYKVWMDDFYLGEYDANRDVPFNISEKSLELANLTGDILDGDHTFRALVDVREKYKDGKYIQSEVISFIGACQPVILVTPTLEEKEILKLRNIYNGVKGEYIYNFSKPINLEMFERDIVDMELNLNHHTNEKLWFGCHENNFGIEIELEASSQPIEEKWVYWNRFDTVKSSIIHYGKAYLKVLSDYGGFDEEIITCELMDSELHLDKKMNEIVNTPYNLNGEDIGQKNIKIQFNITRRE